MNAYFVRVLMDVTVGEIDQHALSTWVVCAETANAAMQIVAKRISAEHQIQGANEAPSGTAERYSLAPGQARRL